ncbi:ImmA/IrrE family metallo-endopeptidase [Lentibacillus cibarius]|uniref:ImmA/IrrE family metallo-endopeptidase n=1 Tax=Lentibacillus cibarius TaxID=2583219 RepID=A0A549YFL2_9BACI|nr:ImmA/IrrE family metallo-endopeptidase [Lentibacillus cibarius]TRM10674.1 ImmA/IrrE family metallo-endopeptidase [Lentibacillus cibarius]
MPEITFEDLPQLLKENKEIRSEIRMSVNQYLQTYHPKGWNRIDGAKKAIEQNHYLIEAPIQDLTFGGFIRTTNNDKSIFYINTAQPRMYQNFVLFHELYHLITIAEKIEDLHFIQAEIDNSSNERKADYFASLLLLDEYELRSFFSGPENQQESLFTKILLCMITFKAPYKAILIRLYELSLIELNDLEELFDKKLNFIKEFQDRGIDTYILEASNVKNFKSLETLMARYSLPAAAQQSNNKILEEIKSFFSKAGKENKS